MGNTALLISSSNYAKTPHKCAHRRRFVFLVFSNFSETPCMKVGLDVRIPPSDERGPPSCRREIPFSCVFLDTLPLLAGNSLLGPVHMIPGQLIPSCNSLTPGINFASVHCLMSIVHMNFSLPRGNFKTVVQHQVTGLAKVTFLHVNRTQKLPWGKSSLHVCSLLFRINSQ